MLVGVPKEIKTLEFRVGLTTGSVEELVHRGHQVIVQAGAGEGIGLSDDDYRAAGAVDIRLECSRADNVVEGPGGLRTFLESVIVATAAGRPRLAAAGS